MTTKAPSKPLSKKMTFSQNPSNSSDSDQQKPKKPAKATGRTVNDYVDLIETVARVEFSRLPNHLIDYSEVVNIGAIAVHVLLTSNPEREFNVTYISTAIKWAIRNELRYRYKWYSLKQVSTEDDSEEGEGGDGGNSFDFEKSKVRETVYETILSVDSMLEADNPHEIKDSSYTPEETSEYREMAKIVREAVAKLPERERQIVEARFFKNMKMREIGETFNISPSRTSRVVQAALDKVKVELLRRGYTPQFD